MNTSQLALAITITALLLFGCSKTEREPEAVPKNHAAVEEPAARPSEIAERAGEISQAVVEKAVDKTIEVAEQTAKKAETAKEAVIENTALLVTNSEKLVKKTEATTKKVAQQTIEKTAAAMDKAEVLIEKTTGPNNSTVNSSKPTAPPRVPETITLENKKGKITMPHKKHAATFACGQCHGDATPGPFELGQERGHSLCKECHKEKGGPTACNGCHEKKAIKPVEGC